VTDPQGEVLDTLQVLALPGEGEPFERVVGVRIASYTSASFSYRFGRKAER
jgi:hypothetical protein